MHRSSLIMVLSSIFAAGSIRVATEEEGIPMWVWPVLILMVGFLVWWWLRKPAEEVSAPFLSKESEHPQSTVSPLIA
jgi:cytochrome c-type biogenesis protein CcmH/NrfF